MNIFVSKDDGRYRYLYKITNTLTGQYYYGIHTTYNLDDGYMGSGKRLKLDQKRLGINNFKKEYIEFFNDNDTLRAAERKVVNWDILRDPLCYNIALGGSDVRGVFPIRNIITGEIKAKPLNDDYDKTIWVHITTNRKRIHKIINNIVVSKYVYESDIQKYLDEGWVKGSNDHSILGKIKIIRNNDCIVINPNELQKYLDEGWVRGSKPSTVGKTVISKDGKNKFIYPDELQKYLDEGWVKGKIKKIPPKN